MSQNMETPNHTMQKTFSDQDEFASDTSYVTAIDDEVLSTSSSMNDEMEPAKSAWNEEAVVPTNNDTTTPLLQEDHSTNSTTHYNDQGAEVTVSGDHGKVRYSCGRHVVDSGFRRTRHFFCNAQIHEQCPSCVRYQASLRLSTLQERFPCIEQEALIVSLRSNDGDVDGVTQDLKKRGAVVSLDAQTLKLAVENWRLPKSMAKVALERNNASFTETMEWLEDAINLQACFEQAAAADHCVEKTGQDQETARPTKSLAGIAELMESCAKYTIQDTIEPSVIVRNGHSMAAVRSGQGQPVQCCSFCACRLPSPIGGNRQCQACYLCEACIDSGIVFECPSLENGSTDVHPHPLTFTLDRIHCICDAQGPRCGRREEDTDDNRKGFWSCIECDFDVCTTCIRQPLQEPIHNEDNNSCSVATRTHDAADEDESHVDPFDDDECCDCACCHSGDESSDDDDSDDYSDSDIDEYTDDDDDSDDESTAFSVGDYNASMEERRMAMEWDHAMRSAAPEVAIVVGTGRVGTTAPRRNTSDDTERNSNKRDRSPSIPVAGSLLSKEGTAALKLFKKAHGSLSAVDVTLAEYLLRQAETAMNDASQRRRLFGAVAVGRIDLAGSLLLLSHSSSQLDDKERTVETCWCGDPIDSLTDGPVGCLLGHRMHASCASDLLLGGGACPTCRSPIFHSRVAKTEIDAAEAIIEENAAQTKRDKKYHDSNLTYLSVSSSGELDLQAGDIVRISPDRGHCLTIQKNNPLSGGWNRNMAHACGSRGRVIEILQHNDRPVSVRIQLLYGEPGEQPRHTLVGSQDFLCEECDMYGPSDETGAQMCSHCHLCERCCSRPRHLSCNGRGSGQWCWDPSLLCVVRRATVEEHLDDSEFYGEKGTISVARDATRHVTRLRAELVAVKASRDVVNEKLQNQTVVSNEDASNDGVAIESELSDALSSLSPPDICRARHLLKLAKSALGNKDDHDGTSGKSKLNDIICKELKAGNLDTVARIIRRENAAQTVEKKLWANASLETSQYVVKPFARVDLVALPSFDAPKTGFSLEPGTRFWSQHELLDEEGNMWIEIKAILPDRGSNKKGGVAVDARKGPKLLLGARVCRGRDFPTSAKDAPGEGVEGTITKVHLGNLMVTVHWDGGHISTSPYRAGYGYCYDLEFSKNPPPQGWLCVRPGRECAGGPCVVQRAISELSCCGCRQELEHSDGSSKDQYLPVSSSTEPVVKGDRVLVAATLNPVIVQLIDRSKNLILCSIPVDTSSAGVALLKKSKGSYDGKSNSLTFWYRPEDLVLFKSSVACQQDCEERRLLHGRAMTRREFVLICDKDVVTARKEWSNATSPTTKPPFEGSDRTSKDSTDKTVAGEQPNLGNNMECGRTCEFASCLKGHLLHSRCLQGALLKGGLCPEPGCNEPLWLPKVKRTDALEDADTCTMNCDALVDAQVHQAESELSGQAAAVTARALEVECSPDNDEANLAASSSLDLKMCPACCAGPLYNENCSNMTRHHGECTACLFHRADSTDCTPNGIYRASTTEIAEKMTQLSDTTKSVADVLPRCPTHDALVMFNGCMACGHLFTNMDWYEMPTWDPLAKDRLELDKKKMNATKLLAEQVQQEAAMLQYERGALMLGEQKQ